MRKVYGQSGGAACPFCSMQSTARNPHGVPVCKEHATKSLPDLKCVCGNWLDQRESKFGVFYTCMDCGAVSFSKMMMVNGDRIRASVIRKSPSPPVSSAQKPAQPQKQSLQDRIEEKLRKGEPLTPEEVDML